MWCNSAWGSTEEDGDRPDARRVPCRDSTKEKRPVTLSESGLSELVGAVEAGK
jgi:hypothetical protein